MTTKEALSLKHGDKVINIRNPRFRDTLTVLHVDHWPHAEGHAGVPSVMIMTNCGSFLPEDLAIDWEELPLPTAEGQHLVTLGTNQRMVNPCHVDPFRTHYFEGPGVVKLTVHSGGGYSAVYGSHHA